MFLHQTLCGGISAGDSEHGFFAGLQSPKKGTVSMKEMLLQKDSLLLVVSRLLEQEHSVLADFQERLHLGCNIW
jgi:hypothetical protein